MPDLLTPLLALTTSESTDPVDELFGLTDVLKRASATLKDVDVDELQVDHDYQRPPDREKVAAFTATMRAGGRVAPIKVNRREDGSQWITDGQHRWLAAKECGRTRLRAHVTDLPSQAEPAQTNLVAKQAQAVTAHQSRGSADV